jgi:hypothetical protein
LSRNMKRWPTARRGEKLFGIFRTNCPPEL